MRRPGKCERPPGFMLDNDMQLFSEKAAVRFVLATLLVFFAAATMTASQVSSRDTTEILSALRHKYDLPALAVVVVKDGKICDSAAVGVRKVGDPTLVTTNDEFHIGSCTKSMTATLAAKFIEEGRLRWNTTIGEVFPELKGKMDPQYEDVTVEQLLQHRGGFSDKPPSEAWAKAWKQEGTPTEQRYEFIQAVLTQPPAAKPGTKMIYSNQGYAIVGAMLEKISGHPWEELMRDDIFKPLHMDSAGFGSPGTPGQVDEPWGHDRTATGTIPTRVDNPPAIGPAGTVHCSLADLARFAIAHMEGEKNGGLLKAETFRRLHTPPPGGDYADGWICVSRSWAGGRALTHAGSNTKWYLVMWFAPEKDFAVIVGTNIGGDTAGTACDETVGAMIKKWLK